MSLTPQQRVLLYIFILSLLPICVVWYLYSSREAYLQDLQSRVLSLQEAAYLREKKQVSNQQVRNYFRETDRYYIDKQIESLSLLQKETEQLQKLSQQPNAPEDPKIARRLNALEQNELIFSEGTVQSYPYFNEIVETLAKPVEVDVEDIRRILARLEGQKIDGHEPGSNRPQLIITDFRIDKKSIPSESEFFTLNLKLIKREYF